jgi:antirestriction protein ArdC
MPPKERFDHPEAYYATLFHELVHSTGHESRLGRPGITESIEFGKRTYSKEELVAEMGATFLCGQTGIENAVINNSASYIASWLRRLQNDPRLVVQAAAQSQKAADYILNRTWGDPKQEQGTRRGSALSQ